MNQVTDFLKGQPVAMQVALCILVTIADDKHFGLDRFIESDTRTAIFVGLIGVTGWLAHRAVTPNSKLPQSQS